MINFAKRSPFKSANMTGCSWSCLERVSQKTENQIRGDAKKSDSFGKRRGLVPDHDFRSKNYLFLFLLPFNPEASKACKNSQKKTVKQND